MFTGPARGEHASGGRCDDPSCTSFHCRISRATTLAQRVREFAGILTRRRGTDLHAWMTTVDNDDVPALHAFVHGLRMDLPAVVAGLTLPYSNGPIEGANTILVTWNLGLQG